MNALLWLLLQSSCSAKTACGLQGTWVGTPRLEGVRRNTRLCRRFRDTNPTLWGTTISGRYTVHLNWRSAGYLMVVGVGGRRIRGSPVDTLLLDEGIWSELSWAALRGSYQVHGAHKRTLRHPAKLALSLPPCLVLAADAASVMHAHAAYDKQHSFLSSSRLQY